MDYFYFDEFFVYSSFSLFDLNFIKFLFELWFQKKKISIKYFLYHPIFTVKLAKLTIFLYKSHSFNFHWILSFIFSHRTH